MSRKYLSRGVGLVACLLAIPMAGAGCWLGTGDGVSPPDAQLAPDGHGGADAVVTGDASAPGGGTISIYLAGDLTPKTFTDGLVGQTPTSFVIALSEYWVQTSLDDPAPVYCFDTGGVPVEADMYSDTLVGTCQTRDLPSAVYTHGRVKVEWAVYTVTGTLHYGGVGYPGELTFFRAYSDTTRGGESYVAGEGTVSFDGATQLELPMTYDPPQSVPGMRLETIDGEMWMTFPYSYPLAVDQTNTDHHWARFHWEIFEGFRWQDDPTAGYTAGVWDLGATAAETETVVFMGVTGYHTTASSP